MYGALFLICNSLMKHKILMYEGVLYNASYSIVVKDLVLEMYMVVSLICGAGAAIWSETYFGPTGHNLARNSPLPHVWPMPRACAIF
jgi:hypothetical protein